jgi:PRTRC genetic system protein A
VIDLHAIFARLHRHHIATPTQPLPPEEAGVTWIWADNGIFKRGVNEHLDALIPVTSWPGGTHGSGFAALMPGVRWRTINRRLPDVFLHSILEHARTAAQTTHGIDHPIEQQYLICREQTKLRVLVPHQDASTARVTYHIPDDTTVLLDLHSHHGMRAYFSATDDRDDQGLSVSAVIGRIFDRPEIVCRINVYGHHHRIPALTVFERLSGMVDTGGRDADAAA